MKRGAFGRCRPAGYTLVETLIVLVILGVLAALGLPRFASEIRHQRVNAAAVVVAGDLELASSLAAARRYPVELRFDSASSGYRLVPRDSSRTLLVRSLGVASDFRLPALRANVATVQFFPAGTVSSPLSIVLGASDYQRTVSVTRAGLVRVRP